MSELLKSKVTERRARDYRASIKTTLLIAGCLVMAVVFFGAFALYGYHVVEVTGSSIPANRAVKSWERAVIVKTEHLTGQNIIGMGTTGKSTGMIAARALGEMPFIIFCPLLGTARQSTKQR